MLRYLTSFDIATGVLAVIAFILFALAKNQIAGEERKFSLPGRMVGGLALCCFSASVVLPLLFSPRLTLEGPVEGFHQVTEFRASHFEFRLRGGDPSGTLRAYYFDKGFYFGDPAVANGDVIRASYLTWTNDIVEISEISGHHVGWAYRRAQTGLGAWLLGALGMIIFFSGALGWASDRAARSDRPVLA